MRTLGECEDLDDIRTKLASSANAISNKLRRGPIVNRNTRIVPKTSGNGQFPTARYAKHCSFPVTMPTVYKAPFTFAAEVGNLTSEMIT